MERVPCEVKPFGMSQGWQLRARVYAKAQAHGAEFLWKVNAAHTLMRIICSNNQKGARVTDA